MKMAIIPYERIENKILLLRGQKVMLDRDLAKLYGVENKVLIQAVKRNIKRFPSDFMIQIIRAFVKLRQVLATHKELALKIQEHDQNIRYIFKILKQLMTVKEKTKPKIGFVAEKRARYGK